MALILSLKEPIETTNDNKILVVRDNTGDGNTGWGTESNPSLSQINLGNYILYLQVTITNIDNISTTYDPIDFISNFDPNNTGARPDSISELKFVITHFPHFINIMLSYGPGYSKPKADI